MDNSLNNLLSNIINYFVTPTTAYEFQNFRKISTLIRIHSEKLSQCGDVSFPSKTEIWLNYFPESNRELNEAAFQMASDNVEVAQREKEKFLLVAKEWQYPVEKLFIRQERIHLQLQRHVIVKRLVPQVLISDNYGQLQKEMGKYIYLNPLPVNANEEDLSFYRSKLMFNALKKLLKYSRWNEVNNKNDLVDSSLLELQVQSVASKINKTLGDVVVIKCGLVTDPANNGKLCQLPTKEYLR